MLFCVRRSDARAQGLPKKIAKQDFFGREAMAERSCPNRLREGLKSGAHGDDEV